MMNNTFFSQPNANGGNYFNQPQTQGFPVQNGIMFNNTMKSGNCNLNQEDLSSIKKEGGKNLQFTKQEQIIGKWNFRDENGVLCLDLIDANTDLVRAKWTNEEFHIVQVSKEFVIQNLAIIDDIVKTAKALNPDIPDEILGQLYVSAAYLIKFLPDAYESGIKNYSNIINQLGQAVGIAGYQGAGMYNNNMLFAGQYGQVPNYVINESSQGPMMMNYNGYPNQYPNQYQQPQQFGGYNGYVPNQPQPVGGTMMGNGNPFIQGGAPQQVPTMNNGQPSVPFPGTPQMQNQQPQQTQTTPQNQVYNPPIGQPANNNNQPATTATSPF